MLKYILIYSIFAPCIFGIIKYKSLEKPYKIFVWYLITGALSYIIGFLLPKINEVQQIRELIYTAVSNTLLLFMIFTWRKRQPRYILQYLIGIIIALAIYDVYRIGKDVVVAYSDIFDITLVGIVAIPIIINEFSIRKGNLFRNAKILILIPTVILFFYYAVISLLMMFLFNKDTQALFLQYYYLIWILSFINYIAYFLAILWAPKEEVFL